MSRNIIITGASSLIGQAITKRLTTPGDRLLLHCCHNADVWADTSLPEACEVVCADFSKPDQLDRFCGRLGETDLLINVAAVTKTDLLPNLERSDIDLMIDVNIRALIAICQAVLPGMVARRTGIVINISSVAAARGNIGQTVYAGSKGFVESFTRSVAAEYGARGIRCNTVAPGAIDAGSLRELLVYAADEVKQATSAGRLGTADDVAAAVAFLCSPEASFINGKCLAVDGGFSRGI